MIDLRKHAAGQKSEISPCVECGQEFSTAEMIHYETDWICAACKAVYFQKLIEGANASDHFDPNNLPIAGPWVRLAAYAIDWVIINLSVFLVALGIGLSSNVLKSSSYLLALFPAADSVGILMVISYWTITTALFGAPPGAKMLHLRIVGADGNRVGVFRSLIRTLAFLLTNSCFFLAPISIVLYPGHLGIHDRWSRTRVIRWKKRRSDSW
jgi:uncharacterized RDD family membrane protein YckC